MSKIYFIPSGRLGNAIFRYFGCVMLMKENPTLQYSLLTNALTDTLTDTAINVNDSNYYEILSNPITNDIKMHGYCQYDKIYLQNKRYILDFIELHKNEHLIQTDRGEVILMQNIIDDIPLDSSKIYDTVIHIRLDDFNGRPDFIEFEYMEKVFEMAYKNNDFANKTAIVMERPSTQQDMLYLQKCLQWFHYKNIPVPTIESNSLLIDFNIMKQSKIIISSMSTLCWCAAFLSKTLTKCYMPNYNFFEDEERKNTTFKRPIENTILYDVKTTQFKNLKIIIITLEKYPQRMSKIHELLIKLSQIGLQYEIIYSVNGSDIKISNTNYSNIKHIEYNGEVKYYNNLIRTNGQEMTLGELGCAWSHLNIYDKLVKEPVISTKYIVLEDDANLVESLEHLYDCLKHLPDDFDLCHIAMSDWYPFIKQNNINEYWYDVKKQYFNRLTAYIISKKGAHKIIDYINNWINVPADDLLSNMHLQDKLQVFVPDKYHFMEHPNTISISQSI